MIDTQAISRINLMSNRLQLLFNLIIFLFIISYISSAQCCNVGIPSGGTTNLGILSENTIRANFFYRYSKSNDYYQGDKRVPNISVKNGKFAFIGYNLGYGITNQFLIEAEGGYFINKSQEYEIDIIKANGFSNHLVSLKYNIFDKFDYGIELTLGAGIKFPFTTEPFEYRNVRVPYDLQPSTGTLGFAFHLFANLDITEDARIFLIHRTEINQQNRQKYKYGEIFISSVFFAQNVIDNLMGLLQFRSEIKGQDVLDMKTMPNSGGYIFFICPQINYNIDNFNITLIFDYPIYKYYNSKQLANNYSTALNISYLLNIH